MYPEVEHTVAFIIESLCPPLKGDDASSKLASELSKLLLTHCSRHWYPADPLKGSAFRALTHPDPLVMLAASASGVISPKELIIRLGTGPLGNTFTLWIDPGSVTCRSGNNGALKDVWRSPNHYQQQQEAMSNHLVNRAVPIQSPPTIVKRQGKGQQTGNLVNNEQLRHVSSSSISNKNHQHHQQRHIEEQDPDVTLKPISSTTLSSLDSQPLTDFLFDASSTTTTNPTPGVIGARSSSSPFANNQYQHNHQQQQHHHFYPVNYNQNTHLSSLYNAFRPSSRSSSASGSEHSSWASYSTAPTSVMSDLDDTASGTPDMGEFDYHLNKQVDYLTATSPRPTFNSVVANNGVTPAANKKVAALHPVKRVPPTVQTNNLHGNGFIVDNNNNNNNNNKIVDFESDRQISPSSASYASEDSASSCGEPSTTSALVGDGSASSADKKDALPNPPALNTRDNIQWHSNGNVGVLGGGVFLGKAAAGSGSSTSHKPSGSSSGILTPKQESMFVPQQQQQQHEHQLQKFMSSRRSRRGGSRSASQSHVLGFMNYDY